MHQYNLCRKKMTLVALLFFLLLTSLSSSSVAGFRASLTHVDSSGGLTSTELLHRAVQRSRHHARLLAGKAAPGAPVEASVRAIQGAYYMDLSVGSPAVPLTGVVSSGSELNFVNCGSCARCFPRPKRSYNPAKSSTFKTLSPADALCPPTAAKGNSSACLYSFGYVGISAASGVIARDSFGFGSGKGPATTSSLAFMCAFQSTGYYTNLAAVISISRGNLSLISQLKATKFSYCLTSLSVAKSSPLVIGSPASLAGSKGKIQSTPLLPSPPIFPAFFHYYVSLRGISVGGERLPIPKGTFKLRANGTGGLVIDTASSLTSLDKVAFDQLKKKIVSTVSLPVVALNDTYPGNHPDLCFRLPGGHWDPPIPTMPDVVFHLAGGARLRFPRDKYMILNMKSSLYCLAFIPLEGLSILGSYQQENLHVLFDLKNSVVSFAPAQCDQL